MTHADRDATGLLAEPDAARLLDETGHRVADADLDPWIADVDEALLRSLYADMLRARRVDAEATTLQRQGELGLWPPLAGQEAAQVGSAHALGERDFVFSSYREHAVALHRGVGPAELLTMWRGSAPGGWNPYDHHLAAPQIIIGAQTLHATGYAMGLAWNRKTDAAITYFGDGATSEGDVSEAMIWAASFQAPVVFFCQNNGWAISEPVGLQSRQPLVKRADGAGMPGVRVDGNDVLAVLAATRQALARARAGEGPSFIEAVTYRMGPHTTADDPTRYRGEEDLAAWRERDPIARLRSYLEAGTDAAARGGLDAFFVASEEAATASAAELRAAVQGIADPEPLAVFDHVYAEPNTHLDEQRERYARYLAMFEEPRTEATGEAR
ncbi:pyruvate dehydrogenase (acetyl-transferring) E1 component subunit alpha [Agromyces archimandritae]|uniref:Pyruvate dehydrogenase (Acetyl-transferring) E1 component subunit alpha n=1 Tax=Agromyces archimandritae TaxID=2781962 RepID=A0A975FMV0_9MICO|nr:pyruvate dehydrogenase (acetyl-transferring) E1 component subunit alpha [Agromyces archimandritae]QTX05050.1 pyruvate dehydrogenase (acetyl-transferring) E1 component subunit alpha [Agromyces archimandritae]